MRSATYRSPARLSVAALLFAALMVAPAVQRRAQGNAIGAAEEPAPAESAATAEAEGPTDKGSQFSTAQLEQMVAPIALYPDALLMQILMASTYPLEIVQADRWARQNPGLSGKALEDALKEKDWDPSVKSLCALKDVLKNMSDNLDWTQDLGDAFLSQKTELLDTVQRMRNKAYDSGNLKTTEEQTVTVSEEKIIVIESSSPSVVYVPQYSPVVVYGAWSYPTWYYPPYYRPPPPGWGAVTFAAGVAVGAAIWGGCSWGWGRTDVNININRYNEFNRNTNVRPERAGIGSRVGAGDRATWQHNPEHRKGVNYRDGATAQKYGGSGTATRVTRDQARGYDRAMASDRRGASAGAGATASRSPGATPYVSGRTPGAATRPTTPATRPSLDSRPTTPTTRPSAPATRPSVDTRPSAPTTRPSVTPSPRPSSSLSTSRTQSSAWSGSRQPSLDRSASARGSYSRSGGSAASRAASRPVGGDARAGGAARRR